MVNLFLAVAFVLTCQQEACSDLRSDDFKRVAEMVDERADIVWSKDTVSRSVNMHLACEDDKDCYDNGSVCIKGRYMCDPEFTYNTSKQACVRKPGGMYQPCVKEGHCHINGSVCFKGRCMCTPGLSFHKREQTCVRKCSTYGETMSIYEGLAIDEHNKRQLSFIYSEKKCVNYCTTTTNFLCLSVDMYLSTGQCCLSNHGYLDVDVSD